MTRKRNLGNLTEESFDRPSKVSCGTMISIITHPRSARYNTTLYLGVSITERSSSCSISPSGGCWKINRKRHCSVVARGRSTTTVVDPQQGSDSDSDYYPLSGIDTMKFKNVLPLLSDASCMDGVVPIALGGHRGLGANAWSEQGPLKVKENSWRFRENTISSFLAAIEAGATFIEFDVQVTADGVAVLFHDNYLVYGDEENPSSWLVKDLPLEQFKGASPSNSVIMDGDSIDGMSDDEVVSSSWPMLGQPGSVSDISDSTGSLIPGNKGDSPRGFLSGRSPPASGKLLRQQQNGVIACSSNKSLSAWQVDEEDEFPTLLEVFEKLPSHIAFDIEIKMTTPDDVVQTPEEDLVRIDTILDTISEIERRVECEGMPKRPILFSSFDPDVCARVKQKRSGDVVMFLSTGGASWHADPRRGSIDAAIEFASLHSLQGIILDSGALFADQGAVARASAKGLLVMTYGEQNDDPLWVAAQRDLNVHGVIVDDVRQIHDHFMFRDC